MIRKFCRLLAVVLVCCLTWALAPGARAANLAVERQIFDFLTQQMGLNSAAASGVLANIEAESGFSLTAYGDGGTSFGLCQWHNSRFTNLRSFCRNQGYDYTSLEGQLNYLSFELRTKYTDTYNVLRNVPDTADGAYQAAYYWCVHFEVPANKEAAGARRGRTAQLKYWVRYGGTVAESQSVLDSEGYNSSLFSGDLSVAGFYWEEEETIPAAAPAPAETTPVSQPARVTAEPSYTHTQADVPESTKTAPVYRFHYTPHHSPAAVASAPGEVSPISCIFLCAGEPKKRFSLPEDGADAED